MGGADTHGGVPGAVPVAPGNVGRASMAAVAQALAGTAEGKLAAMPDRAPVDPLSRPYRLPSRGVYYRGHDGMVVISPMRGEQEETLAGAAGNREAQLEVLRHVVSQCVDLRGLALGDLLLDDWVALTFHFFALSAGSDVIELRPTHGACGKAMVVRRELTAMPCASLRVADAGEPATWPAPRSREDDDEAIIREIEGGEGSIDSGPTERVLAAPDASEPFTTPPLPITRQRVTWRYHRVSDLIKADEFASRVGDSQTRVGSPLHSYLMALQVVAIDDQPQAVLQAIRWVKQQPSVVLNAWRDEMAERAFGYDVMMRIKCAHCGGWFTSRLPLDGSLFRRRARS